jgi:hypothetical protein
MNAHKGEVPFEANGQHYTLRFSIDAICALEEGTKRGIIALTSDMQNPDKMSITLARQFLWAGLQEKHPDLTVKEAGELIPAAGGLLAVIALLREGLSAAFPKSKDESPRPQKAGSSKNGIGPHSTAAGAASGEMKNRSGVEHPAK